MAEPAGKASDEALPERVRRLHQEAIEREREQAPGAREQRIRACLERLSQTYPVDPNIAMEELRAGADLEDPELSPARLQAFMQAMSETQGPSELARSALRVKLAVYGQPFVLQDAQGRTVARLVATSGDIADATKDYDAEEIELIAELPKADADRLIEVKARLGARIQHPSDNSTSEDN